MTVDRQHLDGASAPKRRPPILASASPCSSESGQRPSSLAIGECMTCLTSITGWMSINGEGGPKRRTYGP